MVYINNYKIGDIMFYNYVYLDPTKPGKYYYNDVDLCFLYEPFYAGKGHKNRSRVHLRNYNLDNDGNKLKTNKIKKIINETGNEPYIIIFNYCNNEVTTLNNEVQLISYIGRKINKDGPLTNITIGGDGTSGLKHTNEAKKKMSLSHKGFKHSEDTKIEMKNRMLGNTFMSGKKHSEETKKKMSLSQKKVERSPLTEETKKKISNSSKGIRPPAEATEKNRKNNENRVNVYDPLKPELGIFKVSVFDKKYKNGEVINAMKGYKHKNRVCPYCGKEGSGGNMTRYHFNNCKLKDT